MKLSAHQLANFSLVLSNSKGEELVIGYDQGANQYFIDRRRAGLVGFSPKFGGHHTAPRRATGPQTDLTLLFDASSVEVFADHGLTVMSALFFPTEPLTMLKIKGPSGFTVQALTYARAAVQPE